MPLSPLNPRVDPADEYSKRIERLRADLIEQGGRALALIEASFESIFSGDSNRAAAVMGMDDSIDAADVAMEQSCVALLTDAARAGVSVSSGQIRSILTIAKVNNELERIADAGVDVCELVPGTGVGGMKGCPDTFRVMANSVIGILRDTITCYAKNDPAIAKVVLQSQHAVTSFKAAILKDAEQRIAAGTMATDFAFRLHEIGSQCELIADHCTNIAEQVIYATTGAIVRHMAHNWVELPKPL